MNPMNLDTALILKPRMVIVRAELFPFRVACSHAPCEWSCPVRDADDAETVLENHIRKEHGGQVLCAN